SPSRSGGQGESVQRHPAAGLSSKGAGGGHGPPCHGGGEHEVRSRCEAIFGQQVGLVLSGDTRNPSRIVAVHGSINRGESLWLLRVQALEPLRQQGIIGLDSTVTVVSLPL